MRPCHVFGATVLVTVLLAREQVARADDAPLAESLFQQGVAAMDRGELARACELLAQSQKLDPAGGTLLNLAVCHERAGELATAWARHHEALGFARRDGRGDRVSFAEEHIKALGPRVPRVSVVMSEPIADARVRIDGAELPASAWATPAPLDPGRHELHVEARGRRAYELAFTVTERETKQINVPPLAREPLARESGPRAASRAGTERAFGWTFTGLGGSAVIASAVLGALAIGAESTADAACPGSGACTSSRGLDASDRASTFATAATISGIVGAVVLAGGLVLLLTASSN